MDLDRSTTPHGLLCLGFLLLGVGLQQVENPSFWYAFTGGWTLIWVIYLAKEIRYRLGHQRSILRIPRIQDSFFRMTSLVLGGIIVLGVSLVWAWQQALPPYLLFWLTVGMAFCLYGILYNPSGLIRIQQGRLQLLDLPEHLDPESLTAIEIHEDRLTFKQLPDKIIRNVVVQISPDWGERVERFFRTNLMHHQLRIENYVR
ncbi:hypothetical protein [Pontibacter sp. G13]|uniref:hypothetical protein n=1 Tax=Pontibacter sp. G13 TaxID=3074898 RepID=UPI00288C17AF|nr:hypothetical protein [Pontibacter sp. G13]WNJ18439.1 hypothetical protein RJD25_26590 [Pontibacter sp. G13]